MKKYKHGHSGYGKTFYGDQDLSKPSYYDRPEFHAYRARVEKIVLSAKEPVTTRYIHLGLGDMAEAKWTLDAIETSLEIERIPGVVDRYMKRTAARRTLEAYNFGIAEIDGARRPY